MRTLLAIIREVYVHLFAVIGALSFASLLASLDWYDWPVVVLQMIDWWKALAYPIVEAIVNPILSRIGQLIGIEVQLNDVAKDYLGVGVALAFSRFRGALFGWKQSPTSYSDSSPTSEKLKVFRSIAGKPLLAIQVLFATVFVWPVEILRMSRLAIFAGSLFPDASADYIRNVRISHTITLLPIVYFLLLVGVSWGIGFYEYFW